MICYDYLNLKSYLYSMNNLLKYDSIVYKSPRPTNKVSNIPAIINFLNSIF